MPSVETPHTPGRNGIASRRHLAGLSDVAALILLVVVLAWFALRTPAWGKFDPLPAGGAESLWYLVPAGVVVGLLLLARRGGTAWLRWSARIIVWALLALMVAMAVSRLRLVRSVEAQVDPWPPRAEWIRAVQPDSLVPAERLNWALRMAAHAALDGEGLHLPIDVPADWPYPAGVTIAVDPIGELEVDLWGRTADGETQCVTLLLGTGMLADSVARRARCNPDAPPPMSLEFTAPRRSSPVLATVASPGGARPVWRQYRGDAGRTGATWDRGVTGSPGWRTTIDDQIRASAAASGDLVLVGSHGSGSLTALDLTTGATRWIARAPNWIHQDPVTDGTIVVAGFGDNLLSFNARAPSGVAAWELATGRRLWTAFDAGSVMTSPVVHDGTVIYATGSGLLRQRAIDTGTLVAEDTLPGFVTMAPPVATDEYIIFALDQGGACALRLDTLERVWCEEVGDLRMLGHSAPSVAGELVTFSGLATVATPSLGEWARLPFALQRKLVTSALFPGEYEVYAGQVFLARDLDSGELRWRSPLFADPRFVLGHTSGTATIVDSIGVIVLPLSDALVAFDPASGTIRWQRGAHDSRGPPLAVDGHAVVAGRDGVIHVHRLADGEETCAIARPTRFDRSGPALAGDLAVFTSRFGGVEAIPVADLLACRGGLKPASGSDG